MEFEAFIKELEIFDLHHYVEKYSDPRWKHFFFIDAHKGCGTQYEGDLKKWCGENCKSDWDIYNGCIGIFADENDAAAFKLRWT